MRILKLTGTTVVVLMLLTGGAFTWFYTQALQSNVGDLTFANRLAVPPLLQPTLDGQGRKVFDLTFTPGETELIPGQH
jgi:hypothetical protein